MNRPDEPSDEELDAAGVSREPKKPSVKPQDGVAPPQGPPPSPPPPSPPDVGGG